ncbi:restriction endonuclease subunit S [Thermosynechococcus sp. QS41]|uniref:restriction endonuclease subunit S n=1 Tax=Thermosynechococcus sp. QS41 TaxID=3074101 RepID=UPI00287813DB|nr:restriction endonuclease subunit S [Thermosynechococcus sp. QS41]WNC60569.1 restriction endonuclease subunit S [Thermosynechococcus sp. QS41]
MTEPLYKLPEGWRWVRLGEVARREATLLKPSDYPSRRFRYLSMEHVGPGQWEEPRGVEVSGSEIKSQVVVFRRGLVLYGKLRPYLNKVVVPSNEGVASTEFVPIFPFPDMLEPEYLGAFLRTPSFVAYASANTTGSRQPRTRLDALWQTPIPLPPLSEQRRIVARIEELMARVREARRLRQEALEDAERLWQSVLADTFPHPGQDLPKGWRWVRLGEVCRHKTGIWGPEAPDSSKGFPVVRSTEIHGMVLMPQKASVRAIRSKQIWAYKLEAGDILINKSSGSPHLVGWPAIFEDPHDGRTYLFSNFMLRLRPEKELLEPWFLLFYLHSPIARSLYLGAQDTTSGLRNLRIRDFMEQSVPLPPLSEQRRIVAHLEEVREHIRALKTGQSATEAELKRLEQSILDKAFRGEL